MKVITENLSDALYVYVTGEGALDIPVGGSRLVTEITGASLTTHRVAGRLVRLYANCVTDRNGLPVP